MNPITSAYLIETLLFRPQTPYARPLRVCTRGVREFRYAWMAGGVQVPGTLETTEEVDRLMRETPGGVHD
jgi:hypothetical protein